MTQDTRKDRRAKIVSLNVRYKSATVDEFIENHSHDVSKGGIFIKTPSPFPPGTLLKFEIRIAGDKAVIAGVGRVVWKRETSQGSAEQPAGMGVKFIKIDDASRAVIDRLVDAKGDVAGAFDTGPAPGAPSGPSTAPVAHAPVPHPPAPVPHTPPPAERPAAAGPFSPAPSAAGMPAYGRKATIMGLGSAVSTAPPARSAPVPAAGNPPSPRIQAPPAGSLLEGEPTLVAPVPASVKAAPSPAARPPAPKPAPVPKAAPGPSPMFPKTNSQQDMPPKGEQTVMKQAAELLEEALLGAGGSMEEIGQNPLFEQVKAQEAKPPSMEHEERAPDSARTLSRMGPGDAAAAAARVPTPAGETTLASAGGPFKASEPAKPSVEAREAPQPVSARPPPSAPRPQTAARPAAAAVARAPAQPASGGGRLWFSLLVIVAGGGLAFFAYTQFFATPQGATPVATTPGTGPSASAPPSASASGSSWAPVPAVTSLGDASADAAPVAEAAGEASAGGAATVGGKDAAVTAPAVVPARPVVPPAPPPVPPSAAADAGSGASPATAVAPPPPPRPPRPPPPPRPPKPPEDDNPY